MLEQLPILYTNRHIIIIIRLKLPHLKWSREMQRQSMKKNLSCRWGIKPSNLAYKCSKHWVTTTHNFHDLHILPLYCCVVHCLLQSHTQQTTNYVLSEHILWVVVAQWLEHWWLKQGVLGLIPQRQLRFFTFFLCSL